MQQDVDKIVNGSSGDVQVKTAWPKCDALQWVPEF